MLIGKLIENGIVVNEDSEILKLKYCEIKHFFKLL